MKKINWTVFKDKWNALFLMLFLIFYSYMRIFVFNSSMTIYSEINLIINVHENSWMFLIIVSIKYDTIINIII